jgi:hypothetical protein
MKFGTGYVRAFHPSLPRFPNITKKTRSVPTSTENASTSGLFFASLTLWILYGYFHLKTFLNNFTMGLLFLDMNYKKNMFTNNFACHEANFRASAVGGLLPVEMQWARYFQSYGPGVL